MQLISHNALQPLGTHSARSQLINIHGAFRWIRQHRQQHPGERLWFPIRIYSDVVVDQLRRPWREAASETASIAAVCFKVWTRSRRQIPRQHHIHMFSFVPNLPLTVASIYIMFEHYLISITLYECYHIINIHCHYLISPYYTSLSYMSLYRSIARHYLLSLTSMSQSYICSHISLSLILLHLRMLDSDWLGGGH